MRNLIPLFLMFFCSCHSSMKYVNLKFLDEDNLKVTNVRIETSASRFYESKKKAKINIPYSEFKNDSLFLKSVTSIGYKTIRNAYFFRENRTKVIIKMKKFSNLYDTLGSNFCPNN